MPQDRKGLQARKRFSRFAGGENLIPNHREEVLVLCQVARPGYEAIRKAIDGEDRLSARGSSGAGVDIGVDSRVYAENRWKDWEGENMLRISELASLTGTTTDTLRYYERLGLLWPSSRTDSGYRLYGDAEVGRLQFIRRAKYLGLSLEEIRGLLGLAEEGECRPLRRQVAELLRHKIDEGEAKMAELAAFTAGLQERYRLALERQDEPACGCACFPASCACLPVQIEELATRETAPSGAPLDVRLGSRV